MPRQVRLVRCSLGIALPLTAVLALTSPIPAFAHEERVSGGFEFVVGWGDEPAYTGLKNTVQVTVTEVGTGSPVTDLGDSLMVEVIKGSETVSLPLEANVSPDVDGTASDYRARLTPTRPGTYTLRLIGTIRSQSVDESFTSAPGTFDEVEDGANIQFPIKDPSPGEIATRIDREVPRLSIRTDTVEAALAEAEERVDDARTVATVAMLVGALGLLAAAGALLVARGHALPRIRSKTGEPKVGGGKAPADQAGSASQ